MAVTFGSLFAGIGGFDLGFERAGMECRWQVEIEPYCQRVLSKHWPDVRRWDDVRTWPQPDTERVDVICGGDPCQENSRARHCDTIHKSLGCEFVRIVNDIRPRIVVRENPAVVRADAPWPWWRFRTELESLGYAVLPFRLRACCFGADHQRDRLFLLAELSNASGERLEGIVHNSDSRTASQKVQARRQITRTPSAYREKQWKGQSSIQRVADGLPNRVERLKAIGNSVCPQVAEWIGNRIMQHMKDS